MAEAEGRAEIKQALSNDSSPAGLESGSETPPHSSKTNCEEEKEIISNEHSVEISSEEEERRSVSSDSSEESRRRTERPKVPFWRYLLMYHRNEVTALVALICTLLSSYLQIQSGASSAKLLRRSASKAQRFFPPGSPVLDLFDGNRGDTISLLSKSEVVLLMYYAPWSAECQEMRWQLEKLARNFSPLYNVKFVAINCWDPGGRCKQSYKLYTYPVVAVYPGSSQALFYTGLLTVDYLYRFLESVLDPIVRLQSSEDVEGFLATSDICLIGFFDFSLQRDPPGYLSFHRTALKYLGKDPMGAVRFGVITQPKMAEETLNMTEDREVRLYELRHYYDSADFSAYPSNFPFKSGDILKWTLNKLQRPHSDGPTVTWVPVGAPLGQKNDHLQDILREGTAVILFTPRNPLTEKLGVTSDFAVFRQVALEYVDCTWGDGERMKLAREEIRKSAMRRSKAIMDWVLDCTEKEAREKKLKECCRDVVLTTVQAPVNRNICDICSTTPSGWGFLKPSQQLSADVTLPKRLILSHSDPVLSENDVFSAAVKGKSCNEVNEILPASTLVDYCCRPKMRPSLLGELRFREESGLHCDQKCLGDKEEKRSVFMGSLEGCRRLRLAKSLGYHFEEDSNIDQVFDSEPNRQFYGMGCETNKTLRFLSMDSRHYSWIANSVRSASANTLTSNASSKIVIVENSTESLFMLSEQLTLSKVRKFIENFTLGHLTYARASEAFRTWPFGFRHSENRDLHSSLKETHRSRIIKLDRITGENFERKVMDSGKDVLLFYTGGAWCGFCSSVFHLLLATAAYFGDMKDRLVFAKIDASKNDLPWEFQVNRYPSLVFFPRLRKTESVQYPEFLPITLPNLLSFVLAQSHPEIRWRTGLGVCSKQCRNRNRLSIERRLNALHTEVRVLKAQLSSNVLERVKMENYESMWDVEEDGRMFDVFVSELRKDLARKETQKKMLRTFGVLLDKLDSSKSEITEGAKEAILLEFLVTNTVNSGR